MVASAALATVRSEGDPRQYVPKGKDLSQYARQDLDWTLWWLG